MANAATDHVFKCFVVMPFSDTQHGDRDNPVGITKAEWECIYKQWIKRAVESFPNCVIKCSRSEAQPGCFIKGIVRELYDCDIVIADITGSRPNVYYELGIRHALKTGTIMITQDLDALPSDLRSYYTCGYTYTPHHHAYDQAFGVFEKELHEKLAFIFANFDFSDNPVSDHLGKPSDYLRTTFEDEKNEIRILTQMIRSVAKQNYALCEAVQKLADGEDVDQLIVWDFYPFDAIYSRLINTRWKIMDAVFVENMSGAIQRLRNDFLPLHRAWTVLEFNPNKVAPNKYFHALLLMRLEEKDEMLEIIDKLVAGVETITFTIKSVPRSSQNI